MKSAWLIVLLGMAVLCVGCAGTVQAPVEPPPGLLYSNTTAPLDVDVDKVTLGAKVGEASTTSILGLISTGDAGIKAAARAGGITTIRHIDYRMKNILGVYSKYTTIVYGD